MLSVSGRRLAVSRRLPPLLPRPLTPLGLVNSGRVHPPAKTAASITAAAAATTSGARLLSLQLGLLHLPAQFPSHFTHPLHFRHLRARVVLLRPGLLLLLLLPQPVEEVWLEGLGGGGGGRGVLAGHAHVGACAGEEGAGLGAGLVLAAQCEELEDVVGLEEAALLGVLQHAVGQELLEDLPEGIKHMYVQLKRFGKICLLKSSSTSMFVHKYLEDLPEVKHINVHPQSFEDLLEVKHIYVYPPKNLDLPEHIYVQPKTFEELPEVKHIYVHPPKS